MDTRLPPDETRGERVFLPGMKPAYPKTGFTGFLRPTFGKIVILLLLSLLQVVPFYISFNCECPAGFVCAPCTPPQLRFSSVYEAIYLLFFSLRLSWTNVLSIIISLLVIYFIACIVIVCLQITRRLRRG